MRRARFAWGAALLLLPFLCAPTSAQDSGGDKASKAAQIEAALSELLSKRGAALRRELVKHLRSLDPKGEASAARLRAGLASKEPRVRLNVAYALQVLRGEAAAEAQQGFRGLLTQKLSPGQRRDALQQLGELPALARDLSESLLTFAETYRGLEAGRRAVTLLGSVGAKSALPQLEQARASKDFDLAYRLHVEWALWKLKGKSETADATLAEALASPAPDHWRRACWVASEVRGKSLRHLVTLVLLLDKEPDLGVASQIEALGPEALPAYEAGLRQLQSTPPKRKILAILARLAGKKPALDAAIPVIAIGLQDSDPAIRLQAVRALGAVGERAKAQLPALERVADTDRDPLTKSTASAVALQLRQAD